MNYVGGLHFASWRPQFVVLHNTAIPKLTDWHRVSGDQRMHNLEAFYRDQQGWSAGPHLFVADDLIWVFTPLDMPGVHSPSWNAISWGVELLGDYSVEKLGAAVQTNASSAPASLQALAGIDPETLKLHKEDAKTTHKNCPGSYIVKSDMITLVSAALLDDFPGDHTPGVPG